MELLIGFSRERSILEIGSEVIALDLNEPYSHCYVRVIDAETMIPMVFQATSKNINTMPYTTFCMKNLPVKEYKLTATSAQYASIIQFLKSSLGVPYGYMTLIAIAIKQLFGKQINLPGTSDRFICSQLAAAVAQFDGIKIDSQLDFETPKDLDAIFIANNIQRTL